MQDAYVFRLPDLIHVGRRSRDKLAGELGRLGSRRPLIVTGPKVWDAWGRDMTAGLERGGIRAEVYDGIPRETTIEDVMGGLERYRQAGCDSIVGVGGGSPMDGAKAIQLLLDNPGDIRDFAGADKAQGRKTPLLCVPTTAGTGSEITRYTVVTDTRARVKFLISTPAILPRVAIIDPELTVTMPAPVTASTGMDALTHAIEGYLSAKGQPTSAALALDAMERIGRSLPTAFVQPENLPARTDMCLGQLHAAMAFGNSSVALVHGMARPLGAHFDMPHGLSNAALLAEVMEFTRPAAERAFAEIAYRLDGRTRTLSHQTASKMAVDFVRELCETLKIPSLGGWGIPRKKFDEAVETMARDALASGSPANNPRTATAEEIVELYGRCF